MLLEDALVQIFEPLQPNPGIGILLQIAVVDDADRFALETLEMKSPRVFLFDGKRTRAGIGRVVFWRQFLALDVHPSFPRIGAGDVDADHDVQHGNNDRKRRDRESGDGKRITAWRFNRVVAGVSVLHCGLRGLRVRVQETEGTGFGIVPNLK